MVRTIRSQDSNSRKQDPEIAVGILLPLVSVFKSFHSCSWLEDWNDLRDNLQAWNINLISEKKKKDRLEIYVPLLSFLDLGLIICVPEIQIQES